MGGLWSMGEGDETNSGREGGREEEGKMGVSSCLVWRRLRGSDGRLVVGPVPEEERTTPRWPLHSAGWHNLNKANH